MNLSKLSDSQQIILTSLFFSILFFVWYPTNILIIDEWFYYRQGLAFSNLQPLLNEINPISGEVSKVRPGYYPLGTPFFIASLLFFGKKAIFLQGFISLVGSVFFTSKALKNLLLSTRYSLILFIYFPATLLSRTLMSDLPSLLIASIFIYLVTKKDNHKVNVLGAGFIAGIGVLFREPNILLFLPFLFGFFFRKKFALGMLSFIGLTVALAIKFAVSFWAFENAFYIKNPLGFSILHSIKNILFYLPFLFVFIPFGGLALVKYKGEMKLDIQIALASFLILYFLYGYNGIRFSGIKSIILGPRFLIPSLPFFAICISEFSKSKLPLLHNLLLPMAIGSIIVTQFIGNYYNSAQQRIQSNLIGNKEKVHLIADLNSVPKIFTPDINNISKIYMEDVSLIPAILKRDTFLYLNTSITSDNQLEKINTEKIKNKILYSLNEYSITKLYQGQLPDNTILLQYRLSNHADALNSKD